MIRPGPKRLALYAAWLVVFASTLSAGVYTFGLFVDVESVGNAEEPNTLEVAEEIVYGNAFGNGSGFGNGGNAGNAFLGTADALDLGSEWLASLP